ncbi:GNAT family N-acetyltransferase [Chamaesiphon polymorphus]|uniref:GNAT family N-acetyltransferase n=1 Tax=Chamaesiphon polymorphus CCALA 037 TaxID=2107692 RepID=A0A2T1FMH6_9CYAN|nr:GNAT family N-acetyltransferase [Chamaesiphon polymorphus]PSB46155.1 GNAT family N-acetyltransferase [Chamaesiphon polymorphus CCALA 037]
MLKIRPAQEQDVDVIFELIGGLAEYENLTDRVTGNTELLRSHLFGEQPYAEVIIAELEERTIGFALFFHSYSTFLTQPGLYLEDVFVRPEYRRQGVGKALMTSVAKIAHDRGCGRLEWSVLDWNQNAIEFYQSLGATVLPDWRICRMSADILAKFGRSKQ